MAQIFVGLPLNLNEAFPRFSQSLQAIAGMVP